MTTPLAGTSARVAPPFRAEHVGSLLRPRALKDAHRDLRDGRVTPDGIRAVEDRCVGDAVKLQEDLGFEVITDGEFRRGSWFLGFVEAVDGLGLEKARFRFHGGVTAADWFGPKVTSKVARRRGITTAEFRFVRSLTRHTPKVTLPAPSAMHFFVGPEGLDTAAYPDLKSFFTDLARVYREELADLARLGCTYVQLDEVPLALLCDEVVRDAVRARGEDPIVLTDFYVAAVNAALEGRPAGMTVGMHLCRGNYKSGWIAAGGYDAVAQRLFNDAHVDAFFLEYDTPRAGGFAPLRFVPAHKTVVLGLVSTKTPVLEDATALARRVDEASRYVPLDRLAVSPQCGFASSAAGNPLTAEDQAAKLGLVARVAREVWT